MNKSNWLKYLLTCAFWVGFVSSICLFIFFPPGSVYYKKVILQPGFNHAGGFTYVAPAPKGQACDNQQRPFASRLVLLEDNNELGPAHALHSTIRTKGKGSYSHWDDSIYFSSSNNSDPNSNGKHYFLRYPKKLPYSLYLISLLFIFILALYMLSKFFTNLLGNRPYLNVIVIVLLNIFATVVLLQGSFFILLQDRLISESQMVSDWYDIIFTRAIGKEFAKYFSGSISYYREHHSLNYALNPDAAYLGTKQFNADYLIRRTEKIRPIDQVHWRALALGGSTTFGEMVPREEDTWVYLLEKHSRQIYGQGFDCINGGVGGYTIAENSIHYTQLLTNLWPDLVILYIGINDVSPRLVGSIKPDYSNYWIPWRASSSNPPPPSLFLSRFYAYKYYYLVHYLEKYRSRHILGEAAKAIPRPEEWGAALKRNSSNYYREYLENLVRLILAQKRNIVILPQYYKPRKEEDKIIEKGVIEHNRVNEEISQKYHLPFLHELAVATTFQDDDLFDECHLNEKGDTKMAKLVFDLLEQRNLITKTNRGNRPPP